MENDLKQNVAKLFAEKCRILEIDSLDDLTGLFDEIAFDGLMCLLSVPWTAALTSEKPDDVEQIIDRIMVFLLVFNHRKTLP